MTRDLRIKKEEVKTEISSKKNKRKNDCKVIEKEKEVKVVEEDFATFFKEEE